jgi:hypothetical protein
MNIGRKIHLMFPVKRGPVEMIPDDNYPPLTPSTLVVLPLSQYRESESGIVADGSACSTEK